MFTRSRWDSLRSTRGHRVGCAISRAGRVTWSGRLASLLGDTSSIHPRVGIKTNSSNPGAYDKESKHPQRAQCCEVLAWRGEQVRCRQSWRRQGSQPHLTPPGFLMEGVSSTAGSERLPLLPSSPIPQCEFDPIPYANLVVDFFNMVPDDVFADLEFLGDFFIFESLGYELDDSQLSPAGKPCSGAIDQALASRQFPLLRVVPMGEGQRTSLA